jgi:hypothetical protein
MYSCQRSNYQFLSDYCRYEIADTCNLSYLVFACQTEIIKNCGIEPEKGRIQFAGFTPFIWYIICVSHGFLPVDMLFFSYAAANRKGREIEVSALETNYAMGLDNNIPRPGWSREQKNNWKPP